MSIRTRVVDILGGRRAPWLAALVGVLLSSTVLATGLSADDYHQFDHAINDPFSLLRREVLTPDIVRAAQESGYMPWWASVDAQTPRQMRPIGAFFLWVDLRLWPGQPFPAHAHSLFMFFWLAVAVGVFYRRLFDRAGPSGPVTAGLAALMYAIDDAHGVTIGYIHGRSRIISVALLALACTAYVKQRQTEWRPGWVLGPLAFAAALATYEAGILALAILIPYAICLDEAPLRERLRALAPYALVAVCWRAIYSLNESASSGSGMYADPLGEPLRFARHVFEQLPIYLGSTLLAVPADPFLFFGPTKYWVGWTVALVGALALLFSLRGFLRRDPYARFFLLVTILGAGPACAAFINDRLLMVAQIGGCGLAARFLVVAFRERGDAWRRPAVLTLIICHIVVAAVLLPFRAMTMDRVFGRHQRVMFATLEAMTEARGRTVVLVNAPEMITALTPSLALQRGWLEANGVIMLGATSEALVISRPDARTLSLAPEGGYLNDRMSVFVRSSDDRFAVGDAVPVLGNTIEVAELTEDGRPARVLFRGGTPLDGGDYLFLVWSDGDVRRFPLPDPGAEVVRPATDLAAFAFGS
ncbi:MAG: hypothetical protein R3B40_15240 [Polyangiales bacterium]|nr:hypothetical protein [Myxococcales bacterium]MCB9658315.1 hypothetical protein [Sandaracinaceae bacterium]